MNAKQLFNKTKEILNKLSIEYDNIKNINWKECKDIIDNIEHT
mgnify:CR=1 FL=1